MSLATTIKSIQDIMRKDVGVDGDAQHIGQLVWLLFLKIWDDRERELEPDELADALRVAIDAHVLSHDVLNGLDRGG